MAISYLDPIADEQAEWYPGTNNYAEIDVRMRSHYTDEPDGGTSISATSNYEPTTFTDIYAMSTMGFTANVSSIKVWVYIGAFTGYPDTYASIYVNGGWTAEQLISTDYGWRSLTFSGIGENDLDDLKVKLRYYTNDEDFHEIIIYAMYCEATYTADTEYLNPNADSSIEWYLSDGTEAFPLIDEISGKQSNLNTDDYIYMNGHIGPVNDDFGMDNTTVGERTITSIKIWAYGETDLLSTVGADIYINGGWVGEQEIIPANSSAGWYSKTFTNGFTQNDMDSLLVRLIANTAITADIYVYAMYAEVTYAETGGEEYQQECTSTLSLTDIPYFSIKRALADTLNIVETKTFLTTKEFSEILSLSDEFSKGKIANFCNLPNWGDLVESFDSLDGWDVSGEGASIQLSDDAKEGINSLQINAVNGVYARITKTIDENFSNISNFVMWINIDDPSKFNSILMYLSSTSDYSKYFMSDTIHSSRFHTGWNRIVLNKRLFESINGESWNNQMIRLRFRIYPVTGENTSILFDDLRKGYIAKPKVLITFDDGYDDTYDKAYPILTANNQIATCFVNINTIDTSEHLTLTEATALYNANWDISSHSKTHVDLTTLEEEELEEELFDSYDWLDTNGFDRSKYYLAYPYGFYNDLVLSKAKERYLMARSIISGDLQPHLTLDNSSEYQIKVIGVYNTVSVNDVKTYIDNNIKQSGTLILMFHRIVDSGADEATEYLTADFQEISDYLETKVDAGALDVETFSSYYFYLTQDILNLTDNLTLQMEKSFSDAIALSDGDFYNPKKEISENLNLTKSYTRIWVTSKECSDIVSLVDSSIFMLSRDLTDILELVDNFNKTWFATPELSEILFLIDSYSRIFIKELNLIEELDLIENVLKDYATSKFLDTISLGDIEGISTYEYFNKDAGALGTGNSNYKFGQTFTVGIIGKNVKHYLDSVVLKLYRVGSPSTFTVELYAIDGNGLPTGSILSSGTIDGNTITTSADGEEVEIDMTEYLLQPSTKYALVFYGAIDSNNFMWHKGSFGVNEGIK